MSVASEGKQDSGEAISLFHEEHDKKQVATEELAQEEGVQNRSEAEQSTE